MGGDDDATGASTSPMDAFAKELREKFMSMPSLQQGYETFYQDAMGFVSAVSWREEKWLQYLLAMHVALFVFVFAMRRHFQTQMMILFAISAAVYASEHINAWAGENWRSFSTQNYFDKGGVFIGIVYAAPLLGIMFMQLLNAVWLCSNMLIKVKRMELKQKRKGKKKTN